MIRIHWQQIQMMTAVLVAAAACLQGMMAAAQDKPDEAGLIAVLQSQADWAEKQTACRALRQIGTAASVPALAALLPDKDLSHLARFALEPMPYPEVDAALRDALGTTQGMQKVSVVISIGARRDPDAVPLLTPLLADADVNLSRAAAGALGRIATPESINALLDFRAGAPEAVRPAVAEGLLAAADRSPEKEKMRLYEELLADTEPMYVRMGAFANLLHAQPGRAPVRVLEALGGDEPAFRDMAAQFVAETSGAKMAARYAEALPKLPAGGQAALIRALATRKDAAAHPAIAQEVQSADRDVRLAAVKALGLLGNATDVAALTGLLASDDQELAQTAKTALTVVENTEVDPAIASAVPNVAPAVRAQLIEVLMDRRAAEALPLAVAGLGDTEGAVRLAALNTLAQMGTSEQLAPALQALANVADAPERSAAEKALNMISARTGEGALPAILEAMNGAGVDSQVVLLRVASRIGGAAALEKVLGGLASPEQKIGDESVRLLSNWPTPDAVPHLLQLAQGDDPGRKLAGLRGYVRLAAANPSAEARVAMLTQAASLAQQPEEKMIALSGWGALTAVQSLDALQPYLGDAAVQNEAAAAIIGVATEVAKADAANKLRAIEALKAVIEKCSDADMRTRAEQAIAGMK